MVPKPCNTRYLKIIFDFAMIFNVKYFRVGWLCAKILSALTQAAMKFVLRMLSLFWMMVLKLVVISTYVEHVGKLVTRWLSMHKNWLLPSLSNVLCALSQVSALSAFPCLMSLFLVFCALCSVSRLCVLTPVGCPQSYVSVPCLPSSVPCLTPLFLVSHPLYPVSCDLSPVSYPPFSVPSPTSTVQCPLFCGSIPLFFSFVPLFFLSHVSCPMFF